VHYKYYIIYLLPRIATDVTARRAWSVHLITDSDSESFTQ